MRVRDYKGVTVRYQRNEGGDSLYEMDSLMANDILVVAESSFSLVAALLGNRTVIYPNCGSRGGRLPHWVPLACRTRERFGRAARSNEDFATIAKQASGVSSKVWRKTSNISQRVVDVVKAVNSLPWPPPGRSGFLAGRESAI